VVNARRFDRDEALDSLATSLEALATDRVDIFLLHECEAADWADEDLHAALEERRALGHLVAYGTATSREQTVAVLAAGRWSPDVIQFASDARSDDLERQGSADGPRPIVHSCLKNVLPLLRERVTTQPDVVQAWSSDLGVNASSLDELAALALGKELHCNPGGVVLFSSNRPLRIAAYAEAVREKRFSADQYAAFADHVRML
jgi:hypothetical protein